MRPTRISGRRPSLVLLVYRFLGRPVGDVTNTALPLNIPQARTTKVQVILPSVLVHRFPLQLCALDGLGAAITRLSRSIPGVHLGRRVETQATAGDVLEDSLAL